MERKCEEPAYAGPPAEIVMMNLRVPKDLKTRFGEVVKGDGRTVSGTIRVMMEEVVRNKGK